MPTDPSSILSAYGLAGLVIAAEATVIIYVYKSAQKLQDKYNAIQEQRIDDAKETRDKITEPLEQITQLGEKNYDLLIRFIDGRK